MSSLGMFAGIPPQQRYTFGNVSQPTALNKLMFGTPMPSQHASISAHKPSLGEILQTVIANGLQKTGMGQHPASNLAERTTGFLNDLTPVGSAVSASQAGNDLHNGDYLGAAGNGIGALLGSVPELGGAAKAMFLGIMAKNADLTALKKAEGMFAKGASREDIIGKTGWFKGADDKWRFEIPDNNISVDGWKIDPARQAQAGVNSYMQKHYGVADFLTLPVGSAKRNEANSLYAGFKANAAKKTQLFEDVAQHPELLEAYPSFRHIGVGPETNSGLNGSWVDETGTLRVQPGMDHAQINSTTAHELQHAVQGQEGFAGGGMPQHFVSEIDDQIRSINDQLRQAQGDEYLRLLDARQQLVQTDPRSLYRRLAGEVEARNVQSRLYFTPERRQLLPPWTTEDIAAQDQIVRHR